MNTSTKTRFAWSEHLEQLPPELKESGPRILTTVQDLHDRPERSSVQAPDNGSWTMPALVLGTAIWAGLLFWLFG